MCNIFMNEISYSKFELKPANPNTFKWKDVIIQNYGTMFKTDTPYTGKNKQNA